MLLGTAASDRGLNRAPAFPESDRGKAFAPAVRAHDHGVAVLQETATLARRQRDRLPAARGNLQQAPEAVVLRRRDRAGPEDVARPQIAAAAGVVGDQLGNG